MMEFTQNNWCERDIMNRILKITKGGPDTIHDVIPTKCHKYPSNTILKMRVFWLLKKMTYVLPHGAYIIPIHSSKMT